MGNEITQKYFEQEDFSRREREVLEQVCAELRFTPEVEIFRGVIYDSDKVGSLIYRGAWRSAENDNAVPAVLKLQGLKPEVDEIDVLERFAEQSESERVRLPRLYAGAHWNAERGYGYLLLEYIDAPHIYTHPFANEEQIAAFCDFYQEYKTRAVREAFFPQTDGERETALFVEAAVRHWTKIALAQREVLMQESGLSEGSGVADEDVALVDDFVRVIRQIDFGMLMEFQHAHVSADDIFDIGDGARGREYVLMSNLFWGYRPQWYDTTFHLWAGVKALRDTSVGFEEVLMYIEKWLVAYKQVPVIATDDEFERKFWLLLAGRAVGALLVDVHNQLYESEDLEYKRRHVEHLLEIFRKLFHVSLERAQLL